MEMWLLLSVLFILFILGKYSIIQARSENIKEPQKGIEVVKNNALFWIPFVHYERAKGGRIDTFAWDLVLLANVVVLGGSASNITIQNIIVITVISLFFIATAATDYYNRLILNKHNTWFLGSVFILYLVGGVEDIFIIQSAVWFLALIILSLITKGGVGGGDIKMTTVSLLVIPIMQYMVIILIGIVLGGACGVIKKKWSMKTTYPLATLIYAGFLVEISLNVTSRFF